MQTCCEQQSFTWDFWMSVAEAARAPATPLKQQSSSLYHKRWNTSLASKQIWQICICSRTTLPVEVSCELSSYVHCVSWDVWLPDVRTSLWFTVQAVWIIITVVHAHRFLQDVSKNFEQQGHRASAYFKDAIIYTCVSPCFLQSDIL